MQVLEGRPSPHGGRVANAARSGRRSSNIRSEAAPRPAERPSQFSPGFSARSLVIVIVVVVAVIVAMVVIVFAVHVTVLDFLLRRFSHFAHGDVEREGATCQRMIGVDRYFLVGHGDHGEHARAAARLSLEAHTDFDLSVRKAIARQSLHQLFVVLAVAFGGRDDDFERVTH